MQAADPEKSGLALADCWSTADKIKLFPHLFLPPPPPPPLFDSQSFFSSPFYLYFVQSKIFYCTIEYDRHHRHSSVLH